MLHPSDRGAELPAANGTRDAITRSIRALLPPSPALFHQFLQERLGRHAIQRVETEAALDEHRKNAFCAATRLLSLDLPRRDTVGDDTASASVPGERDAP